VFPSRHIRGILRLSTPRFDPRLLRRLLTRSPIAKGLPLSTRPLVEHPVLRQRRRFFIGRKRPTSLFVTEARLKRYHIEPRVYRGSLPHCLLALRVPHKRDPFSTKVRKTCYSCGSQLLRAPHRLWGSASPCQCSPSSHSRQTICQVSRAAKESNLARRDLESHPLARALPKKVLYAVFQPRSVPHCLVFSPTRVQRGMVSHVRNPCPEADYHSLGCSIRRAR